MEFHRLRLAGFKSFVDATELRIEPGLTGVVGPNGCGKSNLLEAFRWVMGEASPKSLRGGGMDDVIFAGTARRPGRDFAEVMLTLGGVASPHFPGEETVQIVRRIERGLGSAYRANGRDLRARDVALLFADAATGAHSPALVGQGRISAIIAARPAERRVLLEEAAGIAGLHARRHEAELRLRATEANLVRLDDGLATQAAVAAGLRRAAKAAERYRAVAAALDTAERALAFARWTLAQADAAAAATAARDAEAAVAAATHDAARLAAAQGAAAVALPERRAAAADAAAAVQALDRAQEALAAEATAVARRHAELVATGAALDRDRRREAELAADAAAARARLRDEAAALAEALVAADAARPGAEAVALAAEGDAAAAEQALAAAIETEARAAMAARAAAAAREAAAARQARAEAEAARFAAVPLPDPAALDARVDAAAAASEAAAVAVDRATADIAAAEAGRGAAAAARDAAGAALGVVRAVAAALAAERDALRGAGRDAGRDGPSLLDRIVVAPGDERAFGAAFGDDLAARLGGGLGRFWEAVAGDDPGPPDGSEPLRAEVPAELARRLGATGIAASDAAPELAAALRPGQRLVTRDGRMWRWDGFRSFGGDGADTARRLARRNRLAALTAELADAAAAVTATVAEAAAAEAALAAATADERAVRAARTAAERDLSAARHAHAAAAGERTRGAAQAEATAAAVTRLRADADASARDFAAAAAAAAALPDLTSLSAAVASRRADAGAARVVLATARAAIVAVARDRSAAADRAARVAAERTEWDRRAAAGSAQAGDLAARVAAAAAELAALTGQPARIAADQAGLAARQATAAAERHTAAAALAIAEAEHADRSREASAAADRLGTAREGRARAAADADHAAMGCRELEAACGARFGASPPALGIADVGDPGALAAEVARLAATRESIGPVNLRADLELAELTATIAATAAERAELDTAVARLRGSIGALNREGRARLLAAFARVDGHFRDLFGTLFAGGSAHLELVDADDPLAAGLEIMAQPPGKKLQSLTLLSGGEQALTATALIFALFLTTPAPLCILDEVDAPLDDANVERFCDLLDRMAAATRTRFLIVTHNAVTMSRMHRLYGVTMAEPGVSQLVAVDLGGAERLLAAE